MRHVDDFIDDYGEDAYARWVLFHMRLKASMQNDFKPFMKDHKLFCDYGGVRWRVTGASRLGDVWLTQNFDQEHGYQKREDIDKCTSWDNKP